MPKILEFRHLTLPIRLRRRRPKPGSGCGPASLGNQHGTMAGKDGKIELSREAEYSYWPDVNRIRYGDHYFTIPSPANIDKEYTKGFVLAGTQDENVDRLLAMVGYNPNNDNIRQIVMLTGQRARGKWVAPGEGSSQELLQVTAQYSGADVDELQQASPFIKRELAKTEIGLWEKPFATEYEMCRLAVEAVFDKQIDWKDYPVDITFDRVSQAKQFVDAQGRRTIVPRRREALAVYTLKDGRTVYVINGEAIDRGMYDPRPTSDSQTREAVNQLDFGDNEHLIFSVSVPHTRAAIDSLIRVLSLRRLSIASADVANGKWLPWKELLAGLGEIPSMYKADLRLKAVLAGNDPDTPELQAL